MMDLEDASFGQPPEGWMDDAQAYTLDTGSARRQAVRPGTMGRGEESRLSFWEGAECGSRVLGRLLLGGILSGARTNTMHMAWSW